MLGRERGGEACSREDGADRVDGAVHMERTVQILDCRTEEWTVQIEDGAGPSRWRWRSTR